MIAKLGFVLLFVIFGVLTLFMGVFTTDDARGRLPGIEQIVQNGAVPARPSGGDSRPTAAKSPVTTPESTDKSQPMDNPLIATGASGKVRYTVQLGIFPEQADADILTSQVEAMHLPGIKAKSLRVRDRAGQVWWIAAAGDQDAPVALESLRAWLSDRLALNAARIIPLPPPPQ